MAAAIVMSKVVPPSFLLALDQGSNMHFVS